MFRALRVGLTGLRATQTHIDVVGNNLTNSQTPGFKSDRVTFGDAFYQTYSQGSGPTGNLGGVSGRQVGLGARVGGIDQNHLQGNLIDTGRTFDLALQGQGFFALSNGNGQTFSRVGTFDLDRDGNLVDTRSGFKVLNTTGQEIVLDRSEVQAAVPTTAIPLRGNLPAEVTGPLPEIQESSLAFEEALAGQITSTGLGGAAQNIDGLDLTLVIDVNDPVTVTLNSPTDIAAGNQSLASIVSAINNKLAADGVPDAPVFTTDGTEITVTGTTTGLGARVELQGAAATTLNLGGLVGNGSESTGVPSTLLNDLGTNEADYVPGDEIIITGIDTSGNTVNTSFIFGTGAGQDGETLGDLQTKLEASFPGSTFSFNNGQLQVEANQPGESPLNIVLQDNDANTGSTSWSFHAFESTQNGTPPDTVTTSIEIFDSLGIAHNLTGVFERQSDGSWRMEVTLPEGEGTIDGSPIADIDFNPDGTFRGGAAANLQIAFSNGASTQSIAFDLGDPNSLTGLSQFGEAATARFDDQNGSAAANIVSFSVTQGGVIQGAFSNGKVVDLEKIAIVRFANETGLSKEGGTYFNQSDNSGTPIFGDAQEEGRGVVVAGALEDSNVDTSEEFVRLIAAQRSFQGSARVITSANELFNEVLQLI